MPFVVVLVISAVVLGLVNLLFTYGVVQRLRVHARLLQAMTKSSSHPLVGRQVEAFASVSTKGVALSPTDLMGRVLIGFFAPD